MIVFSVGLALLGTWEVEGGHVFAAVVGHVADSVAGFGVTLAREGGFGWYGRAFEAVEGGALNVVAPGLEAMSAVAGTCSTLSADSVGNLIVVGKCFCHNDYLLLLLLYLFIIKKTL